MVLLVPLPYIDTVKGTQQNLIFGTPYIYLNMASSEKQSNAYALLAPSDSDNGPIQGSDATVSVGLKDALPTKELRASVRTRLSAMAKPNPRFC
jgi:hypothetical protein